MKTYTIHLIRHGITAGNLDGRFIGCRTDMPLCSDGIMELENLRDVYGYPYAEAVFVSPMSRCIQTAEIIYPEAELIAVEQLREMDFGDYEGKTPAELEKQPAFQQWLTGQSHNAPGGETNEEFAGRCAEGFEMVVDHLLRSGTTRAAVVAHGGTIMTILATFGIPKKQLFQWFADNGNGYTVRVTPSLWMRDRIIEVVSPIFQADGGQSPAIEADEDER